MPKITLQCPKCGQEQVVYAKSAQVAHPCPKRKRNDPKLTSFVHPNPNTPESGAS